MSLQSHLVEDNAECFVTGTILVMAGPSGWFQALGTLVLMLAEYSQGFCLLSEEKESAACLSIAIPMSCQKTAQHSRAGGRDGMGWTLPGQFLPVVE